MSAVIAVLTNPAFDALATQLIGQGMSYFNDMSARKAAGTLTEADVENMASKLDVDIGVLQAARASQKAKEQADATNATYSGTPPTP